jgi:UDP-galactose transporter B1
MRRWHLRKFVSASCAHTEAPEFELTKASITWGMIQERLTTMPHGPSHEKWTYSVFLLTVQSAFAAIAGLVYLHITATKDPKKGVRKVPAIFPSQAILFPLMGIALTSSLAAPFGYASLKHVDYVTFILAKSCKLLPVMFLHISLFQKRYPLYKYAVIGFVTLGVAVFTLHSPSTAKKAAKKGVSADASQTLGLMLLGVNLLFDGLTNTVQDHIFGTFKGYSGPQMMCAQNILSTALTVSYLMISPFLATTSLGSWIGLSSTGNGELSDALSFVAKYPEVGWDVLMFSACGAVGQIFIYHTLAHFSSLLLVTVTVTRKMLSMVWSVIWFKHEITGMLWVGVACVFGAVGAEAALGRREKAKKAKAKKAEEERRRR